MGRFREFLVREPATKLLAEFRPAQPGRPPEEAEVAGEAGDPRRPLDLGDDLHRAQVGARDEDAVRPLPRAPLDRSDRLSEDALWWDAGHPELLFLLKREGRDGLDA